MSIALEISKHLHQLFFGGNWTDKNIKESLANITWQQAKLKTDNCNSILALTYHIHYFVHAVLQVLKGNKLDAHDKFSFDHPKIECENDWNDLVQYILDEAEEFAILVAQLPDEQLLEVFCEEKYGTYYKNLQGIIEHSHYHLGQIEILKKLSMQK